MHVRSFKNVVLLVVNGSTIMLQLFISIRSISASRASSINWGLPQHYTESKNSNQSLMRYISSQTPPLMSKPLSLKHEIHLNTCFFFQQIQFEICLYVSSIHVFIVIHVYIFQIHAPWGWFTGFITTPFTTGRLPSQCLDLALPKLF